ncbi:metal ABC transporter permease [Candidatus Bathyarchaeota archaeon]|nr:metal ABC transporter permease [Candidatus Bathyarchaeota archaeon]
MYNYLLNLLNYRFFQNALIGGSVSALACSLIGLFVILRQESMIGDGVAHVSFGGIAIGLFLDINPLYTALIVSIIAVLGISYMRKQGLAESDSATAVILAVGFSTGLIIISLAGGFNVELFSFLFGSILTISRQDMTMISILGIVSLVMVTVFYKELLSITFDAQASRLMGIPVGLLNNIFNILVAVTVVLSIKVVGMILVTALLVLPGLTALQLDSGFRATAIMSVIFGVFGVVFGIFASAVLDVATSGVIVFTLVSVFITVSLGSRLYKRNNTL